MSRPQRVLSNSATVAAIVERFSKAERFLGASYATVRDYCESRDELPQITPVDGDLKNVQRPWAVKAILANLPPPARVLEIGGGEPIASGFLSELGYDVTLVDPYDGFGNGPVDYEAYVERFPHVKIVREYFRPGLPNWQSHSFDAIFSISVLEHLPIDSLPTCFDAISDFLAPNGASIHCFDFILQGNGDAFNLIQAEKTFAEQDRLTGGNDAASFAALLERLRADLETFYLAPQGHHNWRGGRPYLDFPFRKVVSLQSVAHRR